MTAREDREVGYTGDPAQPGVDKDGRTVYHNEAQKTAGDPSVIRGTAADTEWADADHAQTQPTRNSEAAFLTDRSDPGVNPHTDNPRVEARPAVQRQAEIDAEEAAAQAPADETKEDTTKTSTPKSKSKAASGTQTPEEGSQS